MRSVAPAFLLLLAAPALAQDPIPDTTAAWRYFPLEVGNVWEYVVHYPWEGTHYERLVIPRDTTVSGNRYDVLELYYSNSDDTAWELRWIYLWRFDTLSTQIIGWTGSEEVFVVCPFGADFNTIVDCNDYEKFNYAVSGGYLEAVEIGGDQAPAEAWKSFYPDYPWDGDVPVYVAPIGFHHMEFWICSGLCRHELEYARLVNDDGTMMEYGLPVPVATEPQTSPPGTLTVWAYPNPFSGSVTLELAAPVPQAVTIEVFDVLGRRVRREAHVASGGAPIPLDGRAWAPGVYVVRATGEGGAQATARLVRR